MKREEYILLEEIDQLSLVLSDGILLSQNRINEEKVFVYEMGDFYVILTFDTTTDELKSLVTCLDCTEYLVDFPEKEKFFDPASRPNIY